MKRTALRQRAERPRCDQCRERFNTLSAWDRYCPDCRRPPITEIAPVRPVAARSAVGSGRRRVAGNSSPMRGGEARPKEEGRLTGTLRAPTVAQRRRFRRIKTEIGCMACRHRGEPHMGDIDVHHVLSKGGRRLGHDQTFGLHSVGCHQNGTAERPARHPMQGGRVMFEKALGATEAELLAMTNALLDETTTADAPITDTRTTP